MHASHIHRASITKDRVSKARCSCKVNLLAIRPTITQPLRIFPSQSRGLWWWSRHGNEWSTYLGEHLQTRLQREQKIMRYKYSKALRRRALWESEAAHPQWGWRVPSYWIRRRLLDGENMSSSSRLQADAQEPKKDEPSFTRPLENQYSEEFARFKAMVDKDPFVAVFGKRLESPPSPNNSSWTSLLRIFESVPAKEGTSIKSSLSPNQSSASPDGKSDVPKQGSANAASDTAGARLPHAPSTAKPIISCKEEEYEFDPISMKKVLKKKLEMQPPTKNEQKPFLSTLFAEHSVEIPVKSYRPHKIYGYTGREESEADSGKKSGTIIPGKKFESSRLQELQKLKAAKLGNAVDATNFCGKYQVKEGDNKVAAFDNNKSNSASE